jgi:6-phosphogluconolactonase
MRNQLIRWQPFESISLLWRTARDAIVQSAAHAIAERGQFLIVLAGGNTPRAVYRLLRDAQTDWSKWHIFYGDERCLPRDHVDRNSLMAEQALLSHIAIPPAQVHAIPAELGAVQGAKRYAEILKNLPEFDLVLLGLGEDGHTASLFPGKSWDDGNATIAVNNAPKPPPERVSISASRLSAAREVLFLVSGEGKQQAINDWRSGVKIPASTITPVNGVDVYGYGVTLA